MLTLFSQVMTNVAIPIPALRKSNGLEASKKRFELFKLFPVLLTITIMWLLTYILTKTNTLPAGHPARSDVRLSVLTDATWFRIPLPFQFGFPSVSVAGVLGMLAGVLACTVESISYYPTVARMSGAPPIPLAAINAGLMIEGLGCVLAGIWGAGNGTNTFGMKY